MGNLYSNLYSAADYIFLPIDDPLDPTALPTNVDAINDWFDAVVAANAYDSIVNVVMFPSDYYSNSSMLAGYTKTFNKPTQNGSYTPRNKKLLTFPFTFLCVNVGENASAYRYEWFSTASCVFGLYGCTVANPELMAVPRNYKNVTGDNYEEAMRMAGFPQVAFRIDSYKAWLAQTGHGVLPFLDLAQGAFNAGAGVASSGSAIGAVAPVFGIARTIATNVIQMTKGDVSKGSITGGIDTALRIHGFWFRRMGLLPEYAEMIDDFFDRYGYASHKLKVPYRHSRSVYTYTKTTDCTITGGCPADDARKIQDIFNKGITFWAAPFDVGKYKSSDGTPIQNTPLGAAAT